MINSSIITQSKTRAKKQTTPSHSQTQSSVVIVVLTVVLSDLFQSLGLSQSNLQGSHRSIKIAICSTILAVKLTRIASFSAISPSILNRFPLNFAKAIFYSDPSLENFVNLHSVFQKLDHLTCSKLKLRRRSIPSSWQQVLTQRGRQAKPF